MTGDQYAFGDNVYFFVTFFGSFLTIPNSFAEFNTQSATPFGDGAPIIQIINAFPDYGYAELKLKKEISIEERVQLEDLIRKYAVSITLKNIGCCSKSKIEDTGKRP